jgi:hypothetical protein
MTQVNSGHLSFFYPTEPEPRTFLSNDTLSITAPLFEAFIWGIYLGHLFEAFFWYAAHLKQNTIGDGTA